VTLYPGEVQHVGNQAFQALRFPDHGLQFVATVVGNIGPLSLTTHAGQDGAQRSPEFVRNVGEQLAAQLICLLQDMDLLLGLGQPHRHFSCLRLFTVEVFQLDGGAPQSLRELFGSMLRQPA